MQLIKKQERLGEYVFYVGMVIHLLLMTFEYGDCKIPFHGRIMHIAFILMGIKISTTFFTKTEWIAMILLGLLGVLSYVGTGDEYFISVIIMIFAAKGTDMKRICKYVLLVAFVFTIGTAVLSLCGIGGAPVDIRHYGRGVVEARWPLGFGHANNLHGTLWYMVALAVYIYFEKMNWISYLLLTVVNGILFHFTVSKSGFIATQIIIVAAFLLKYIKKLTEMSWIYICGAMGVVGVVAVSICSVCVNPYESRLLTTMNRWFTGRIELAYEYAHIRMWKVISSAGKYGDTVDNGFITTFFDYGYIIGIVFILFQLYLVYRTWKERNGVLLAIIVTCAFYTFMEATYTMNNAYLLCNLSYVVAMILISKDNTHITIEPIE